MKRRILSVLLSVILIIGAVVPAFIVADAAVWSGSRVIPSMSGGVYQIANGENLAWFANAVNNGSSTIKGKLTADIQLNYSGSTSNVWTPIGTEAHPFSGTFDGDGHTISGLYVNSDTYSVGLFGYVAYELPEQDDVSAEYIVGTKTYTIKNINVTDSSVNGKQNVGGIVGYASCVGILDCSYSGTVTSTENSAGGIVGWASMSSVVSECHTSGTVTGHQRVGGIAGYANGNTVVTKCYGDAAVSGYMNVGGMVGTLSAASMLGCFFLGSVSADDRAGGLVGYSAFGRMMAAYTISTITNTGSGTDFGGAVGVIYSGNYSSIFYSYEDSGVDGPEGIGRTAADMKLSAFVKEVNHSSPYFCYDYTEINNGYPVLTWMLKLDVWAGDQTMPQQNSSGTYLIYKPSELAWFAGLVNGTLSGFAPNPAAKATVMSNLLFNISVNDESLGRTEWTPIGTASSPFTGTFNGNGYNIAGIYTAPTAGSSGNNVGLFGYVGSGSISGAVVVDGLICGKENVGGIVGYLSGGSVTDCLCSSEVQGDRAVGGIAGNLASSTSKITTCAMIGTVTGTNISNEQSFLQNIGGVAGYSNRASVTKSFASANINAPLARYVGGIVGNSSTGSVTNSYSTSTVVGFDRVGGIIGYNNNGTVTRCYTAGKVSGTSQVGMAFGQTSGSNVTYCYFDESFKSLANTVTGATAKTPTQMTGTYSVSNLSFSNNDFKATADDTYFYYYPQVYSMLYSSYTAIKNASVQSVKRVQNKFIAKVQIDGRTDTYYTTLDAAFNYVSHTSSSVLPTVFIVRDYELTETLSIPLTVGLFGENGAILSRASTLTGAMINVTGDVSIGSLIYGDDDDPEFFIDGNNIAGTTSAIVVADGATLRVEEGVCVRNCRTATSSVRGAAVSTVGGTINVAGGLFDTDISKTVGGAIYSEEGTVTVTKGKFTNCEGTQGCAIYNNNGIARISGGTFTGNIASLYGGAVAGYGVYSETYISGNALFTNNQATYGGAFAVQNYGTFEISGGTITGNRAYSQGGALFIASGTDVVVSGGTIEENYSDQSIGNGIYDAGNLSLKGDAQIDSGNDIYLVSGKYITIPERLTCRSNVAVITPQTYAEGTTVLSGSGMSSNYTKFEVSNTSWHILASGKLTRSDIQNVALVSKNEAYSVSYVSLAEAFAAIGDGDTAIITVIANNTINNTITVHGDVTLLCDDDSFITLRGGSYHGVMFDVTPGAILRFGDHVLDSDQQAQSDYRAGTESSGQLIVDGGFLSTGVTGSAIVNVQSNAQFYMYDDAIIRNSSNTTTGTVTVSGTMHMYGGTISGNASKYGGGVYVKNTGVLNTYGGVIAGNTSESGGDAVYSLGKVVRNINSYDYYYIETLYDGDGEIIGMADPVFKMAQKTDILIGDGEAVYTNTNLIYSADTSTEVYVRNLDSIPESTPFTLNNMTIDLKSYTLGNIVVTGTNVAEICTGFSPYIIGYCVLSDGKLGLNKLVAKSGSGYGIDRTKDMLWGVNLSNNTVGTLITKFVNPSTLIKVIGLNGRPLRNTNTVTTGCRLCLVNDSNAVIDEVYVVVYGDVNADEKIDAVDAVFVKEISDGMLVSPNVTAAQIEAADIDHDGSVTMIDSEHVEACGVLLNTIDQTR